MISNGFETGEIMEVPKDAVKFKALQDFWLGPYALLYPGDMFRWSPSAQCCYYMPCGYDPSGDVRIVMSAGDVESNIRRGFFERVS